MFTTDESEEEPFNTAIDDTSDKIEGNFKAHMQSDNGQYRNEVYKRAENMIPQLDGTYNISDSSGTDLHDYLDLASKNIIQYRTRGQKQRHEANEMAYANRCSAHIEYMSCHHSLGATGATLNT